MLLMNLEDLTKKTVKDQTAHVRVYAGNKIRFSKTAIEALDYNGSNRIVVSRDPATGNFYAFVVDKDNTAFRGRELTGANKDSFASEDLATILGGKDAEWNLSGEPILNGDIVIFQLSEVVTPEVAAEAPQEEVNDFQELNAE